MPFYDIATPASTVLDLLRRSEQLTLEFSPQKM